MLLRSSLSSLRLRSSSRPWPLQLSGFLEPSSFFFSVFRMKSSSDLAKSLSTFIKLSTISGRSLWIAA
uniref:Uncharacterized protein n=1 Tax=Arundo donax TaxID=35708 RepID=A0A0A8ZSC6_ARUDO